MIDYVYVNDIDIRTVMSGFDLQVRNKGYSMNKKARQRKYKDCICAFDIETTTLDEIEQSIMYIWQLQINDLTIIGRSWDEFYNACCDMVKDLNRGEYIVIFVHNLSFEFQYLSSVFRDTIKNVFCMDPRKVLKFDVLDHIEFRCSYLHSNMGLGEYTKKMKVKDFKLSGDKFDYSIKRYPWDDFEKFRDYEKRYILNDVKGLVQSIRIDMQTNNDNLYSFVLTSTGLCRRDVKLVLGKYKKLVRRLLPGLELYLLLRDAFRGGNTHGNRYYSGYIINNVHGIDESSCYPTMLVTRKYPMKRFVKVSNLDFDRILSFIKTGRYAYVMKVVLYNVELKDKYFGIPNIPKAKCLYIENGVYDNGRVLSADMLIIAITDIDLRVYASEYMFDIEIMEAWRSEYGYLPQEYRNLVIGYYEEKTRLKNVEGQEVYYNKAKALLNALYGLSVQNGLKETIEYYDDDFHIKDQDQEKILNQYNMTAFLPYQWGVWCTSYARQALEVGFNYIRDHGGEVIYCDTDSIKYIGDIDITELNKPILEKAINNNASAVDPHGVRHYMGVWEDEYNGAVPEFIHLGAKKYGYRDQDGKLHITIAGVGKKKGAEELEKAGGLEKFKRGFVFRKAGGNEVIYNDKDYGEYEIDGHKVNIIKNIVIKPSMYTLGITNEYSKLLYECQELNEI